MSIRYETITRSSCLTGRPVKVQVAVVRCGCGREVWCDNFTNTCDCGADYGPGGSLLAPRSQWGEETGEQAADILSGNLDLDDAP